MVHGQGRGNKLGYPTANVGEIDTLLPGEGIYAGQAWIDGRLVRDRDEPGQQPDL